MNSATKVLCGITPRNWVMPVMVMVVGRKGRVLWLDMRMDYHACDSDGDGSR